MDEMFESLEVLVTGWSDVAAAILIGIAVTTLFGWVYHLGTGLLKEWRAKAEAARRHR